MPLYDYRCTSCGVVREHRQKISDEPLAACPECGGEYKRIITSVGVIFKGSGFHVNDYRGNTKAGDSPDKTGGDDSGAPKKGDAPDKGSSGESKGDSAPAASPSPPSASPAGGTPSGGSTDKSQGQQVA